MSKTPEVTARSRNCGSWLAPTLEEAGREIPEARGPTREPRRRDWTLSWGKQGAPEESWAGVRGCACSLNCSGGREASKGAEASGRRLRSRSCSGGGPGCWAGGPVPGQGQSPRLGLRTPGRRGPQPRRVGVQPTTSDG